MSKKKKIIVGIVSSLFALLILFVINILPVAFTVLAYTTQKPYSNEELSYLKRATVCSIFKWQKAYTYENFIQELRLRNDNKTAIAYYEKLKNSNIEIPKVTKGIITLAYIDVGDYDTALQLAKENNSLYNQARIYIDTNELDKAKQTVEMIFSTKTTSKQPYLYVAEIQLKEGYPISANNSIDKLLEVNPQHMEAMKVKAKILKQMGKTDEYNKYIQQIEKRQNIVRGKYGNIKY